MKATKMQAVDAIKTLKGFIGTSQLSAIGTACYGEEKQFFFDKLVEMADVVTSMPATYGQDGMGDNAIAYLHYFNCDMDWYITERDIDQDGQGQLQAFGLADLGYGPELGYISIAEILRYGAEIDLYFKPVTIGILKNKAA